MNEDRHVREHGPARVEAEGQVRVDLDAVTPRELHAHLESWDDRFSTFQLAVERRFGRLEKLILVVGLAVASPKLGGPDVAHVVTAAVQTLGAA